MNNRVLLGMSGGVDSSVAAWLLLQQGFQVTGGTMLLFDRESVCGSLSDVEDARKVAQHLGLEHHVFDFQHEFQCQVMDPFVHSYQQGLTPNPCIECNRYLKFAAMLRKADELGLQRVATGHYARVARQGDRFVLKKGVDVDKDQSYFLYHMTPAILSRFQLPLGELTKDEVRSIALEQGFVTARKKDSQDICFVPDGDYGAFLERYTGKGCDNGNYVNSNGEVLGTHRGHVHYTIGQRKGLELAMGHRVYVTGKDIERNLVYIGENEDLFSYGLEGSGLNLIAMDSISTPIRCTAKIRHSRNEAPCTVEQTGEKTILVRFDQPQRAITPGQAVVFYDGDVVLGGATITKAM